MSRPPSWRRPLASSKAALARKALAAVVLLAALVLSSTLGVASCSQSQTNNPLRSFEYAQKMSLVCLQVNGPDAGAPTMPIPAVPEPQSLCAPDPINVNGFDQPFHLFALVTQLVRGAVAVVDLTAGTVVDVDRSSPGIDFLPVGAQPTDIASTADGAMTFVATAEVNKPAIYALPSSRILGDSQTGQNGIDASLLPQPIIPRLTTWPVCALPEAPGPIAVVPTGPGSGEADGGTTSGPGYVLSVVLPGDGVASAAKVITIDPAPLLRGAGLDAGPDSGTSVVPPGSLLPCTILSATELANDFVRTTAPGPHWDDGVPYVDGGVPPVPLPPLGGSCPGTAPVGDGGDGGDGGDEGGAADGGGGKGDAGSGRAEAGAGGLAEAGPASGGVDAASLLPIPPSHASAAALDGQILYVADSALGVIHVVDVSDPNKIRELAPLLATSQATPSRVVSVGQIAISPPTSSYERFLYAIDLSDSPASLIVYDVTDPLTSPHVPLTRPHSELNPFQPNDRLVFGSPVATLTFVQHDWPITTPNGAVANLAAQSGVICNPSRNAINDSTGAPLVPGAYYRVGQANDPEQITTTTLASWPSRLRGIFGFVTLSNGAVVTIDVDDWDGPCRRPDPMGEDAGTNPSDLAPIEPEPTSSTDVDPYHEPDAAVPNQPDPTSQEAYFPVSAPHRTRSYYPLKNDPTAGNHAPYEATAPELFTEESATLSGVGPGSAANPLLLPTATTLADPYGAGIPGFGSTPHVRFAWEDPLVQIDQNWTVTYEGQIPSLQGFSFTVTTPDDYQTLSLSIGSNLLCRTGVEDLDVGTQRAEQALAEITRFNGQQHLSAAEGLQPPQGLTSRLADYVQISSDIFDANSTNMQLDPYWSEDNTIGDAGGDSCWSGVGMNGQDVTDPQDRYNLCLATFGLASAQDPSRDFPILQAYDDHLIIGTFYKYDTLPPRSVAPLSEQETYPANPTILKLLKCCFANQLSVNVRTGGEWVAVGSVSGLLHHVIADPSTSRCVIGCDPANVLMNSRSVGLIAPGIDASGARIVPGCTTGGGTNGCSTQLLPDRNSPLAMRNPMFSYLTFNGSALVTAGEDAGADAGPVGSIIEVPPARDDVWKLQTRGEFTPLTINIAGSTSSVSPQSMMFVSSFGQLAVIDGSSQGLIMIDLNQLVEAHTPYY